MRFCSEFTGSCHYEALPGLDASILAESTSISYFLSHTEQNILGRPLACIWLYPGREDAENFKFTCIAGFRCGLLMRHAQSANSPLQKFIQCSVRGLNSRTSCVARRNASLDVIPVLLLLPSISFPCHRPTLPCAGNSASPRSDLPAYRGDGGGIPHFD
jgi:hypothetical protein